MVTLSHYGVSKTSLTFDERNRVVLIFDRLFYGLLLLDNHMGEFNICLLWSIWLDFQKIQLFIAIVVRLSIAGTVVKKRSCSIHEVTISAPYEHFSLFMYYRSIRVWNHQFLCSTGEQWCVFYAEKNRPQIVTGQGLFISFLFVEVTIHIDKIHMLVELRSAHLSCYTRQPKLIVMKGSLSSLER